MGATQGYACFEGLGAYQVHQPSEPAVAGSAGSVEGLVLGLALARLFQRAASVLGLVRRGCLGNWRLGGCALGGPGRVRGGWAVWRGHVGILGIVCVLDWGGLVGDADLGRVLAKYLACIIWRGGHAGEWCDGECRTGRVQSGSVIFVANICRICFVAEGGPVRF